MEAISDPESPIMKALTFALITPLRAAIREEMKTHKESIGKLTEEISSLKTELTKKNNYIANLESRVDDLEQYSRRNCLVITGIPENENEKTDEVVLDMSRNQLKAAIDASDIDRSHRIPGRPVRRKIIVKFTTYNARRRVLEKKSSLKGWNNRIYINEQSTIQHESAANKDVPPYTTSRSITTIIIITINIITIIITIIIITIIIITIVINITQTRSPRGRIS